MDTTLGKFEESLMNVKDLADLSSSVAIIKCEALFLRRNMFVMFVRCVGKKVSYLGHWHCPCITISSFRWYSTTKNALIYLHASE